MAQMFDRHKHAWPELVVTEFASIVLSRAKLTDEKRLQEEERLAKKIQYIIDKTMFRLSKS